MKKNNNKPRTIAILVNYNNNLDTSETIYNLLEQILSFYKIIVIDNCSTNNSFKILKEKFKTINDVIIIKSKKNGGFAYGNNFGIKYALENFKFDYFLVINNDTISDKEINSNFIEYFEKNSLQKIGILTGKIYYYNQTTKFWFSGGFFSKLKCSGYHFGLNETDTGQYDSIKECDFATGCLWFFKKEIIKEVGYLPEEYFLYLEDVDFSLKLIKKGYKIIYLPNIKVWHKIGASSGVNYFNPKYYYSNRNRIILAKKHLSFNRRILFYLFFLVTRIIRMAQYLLKGKFVNTFEGIRDGLRFNIK